MVPTLLALAALAAPLTASLAAQEPASTIAWFEGSFAEALATAQESGRLLLVELCGASAAYCEKLERQTLTHPPVVELAARFVCVRLDPGTEAGEPVAERYHVSTLPTVLFLEPDGAPRDVLRGFAPPEAFRDELARVLSGEGTIPGLRERVAADGSDLDARYELARKLSKVGDAKGVAEQVSAIERLDPEGRSRGGRRLAMDRAAQELQRSARPSDARFRELLEGETEPDLLYLGWSWVLRVNRGLALAESDPALRAEHEARGREAARLAWPHCPAIERSMFGNEIAWWFYEQREQLPADDKRFALDLAREVTQLQPADADLCDTFACCLHMNGKQAEALAQLDKCIRLQPDNPEWARRREELGR